jgi:hypothetical protein
MPLRRAASSLPPPPTAAVESTDAGELGIEARDGDAAPFGLIALASRADDPDGFDAALAKGRDALAAADAAPAPASDDVGRAASRQPA